MKPIIFTVILIFAFCFAAFAYSNNFSSNYSFIKLDEYVMFDEYQNLNIKDEKARLDNFFSKITDDKTLKGFIVLRLNKNEPRKKKIERPKAIIKHFDARKVDKTRFSFAIFDDEREQTIFYVEPKDVNLKQLLTGEIRDYKIIKIEDLEQEIKELFPKNKKL